MRIISHAYLPKIESREYGNSVAFSLEFTRKEADSFSSPEEMLNYRDFTEVWRGEEADSVIAKLRGLADRIEKHCVGKED